MKKILFIAAIAVLCATSCTRSMKGTIIEKTYYSISILDDEGTTVNFTTVETDNDAIGEIYTNDYALIKYNTLKNDKGRFRSVKKVEMLAPCFYRRLVGEWSLADSADAKINFVMGGVVNPDGLDVNFTNWTVQEVPGTEPVLDLISLAIDENGVSNVDHFFSFVLSEDNNSLTLTDKKTGEIFWNLTRVQQSASN